MDTYEIWVDLVPGTRDLEFVDAVHAYLGHLMAQGKIEGYRVRRRKLGFGPDGLGEWNVSIEFRNLAQVDEAFLRAARRDEEIEGLHAPVYSKVCNFKSGLFRDFPDAVREP
jgi:hypothetical protein